MSLFSAGAFSELPFAGSNFAALGAPGRVTRLGLYGGSRGLYGDFSTKEAGTPVVEVVSGGRRKRVKRYVVEIDGKLFDVENISQAQSLLQQVRDLAEESAERDVKTEVSPKPPRIKVVTVTGKAITSKTLQREVTRTQSVVRKAYNEAARRLAVTREISDLMLKSIEREDEEAAIMLLL